ncbi:hypothetical protein H6G00_00220 [Leptolyngbya sp. FACHB-541]|uniref:hypothetical protein n=1 Tax=Leptolyngbya sp. FACHB-541 TaxID=2692810 RepID=UPI0016824A2A|nr:hypothetical protein [Leptolyngbya sp. FACHB-541]MBD1995054.1 hypothetical protein [Leptolyngbya sp. FACHB-541]
MDAVIQEGRTQVIAIIVAVIFSLLLYTMMAKRVVVTKAIVTRDLGYPLSSPSDLIRAGVEWEELRPQSSQPSPSNMIRAGLGWAVPVVLCYFLYQGQGWAKWVLGVLLATYALPPFLVVLITIFCSVTLPRLILRPVWILIPFVIQLIASWVLLRSPEIQAFLSS